MYSYTFCIGVGLKICIHTLIVLGAGPNICIPTLFVLRAGPKICIIHYLYWGRGLKDVFQHFFLLSVNRVSVNRGGPEKSNEFFNGSKSKRKSNKKLKSNVK
jgi:hypothetical protein